MVTDGSVPRTRRALLAGGLGGLAALVAAGLGRPLPARAGTDGDVVLGTTNTAARTTLVQNTTTTAVPLKGRSVSGDGLAGATEQGAGVAGTSANGPGVRASSGSGPGVESRSDVGPGIDSRSMMDVGIYAESEESDGVHGAAGGLGDGVVGESLRGTGVVGYSAAMGRSATAGISLAHGTGVYGWSGDSPAEPVATPVGTGVYGYSAVGPGASGVCGRSTTGRGVRGEATSGTGVYAAATTGYALRAVGRVKLDKCAGVATIAAGARSVTVTPGIDLTSTSAVVATLQGSAGSDTTTVSRVFVNASTNRFAIHLTHEATRDVRVAWHVFG